MTSFAATCPRCRRSTASPFAVSGVCLRCAGERVFTLDVPGGDDLRSGSHPGPFRARRNIADVPDRIGPYEIIEELGRGGMASIYAAQQPGLGRIVALKVLPTDGPLAGLDVRFLREAQTVARLHHPHIVAVYDYGRTERHVYFSMEYLPAGDLGRRLRKRPFLPREAATVLEKVAGAVAVAHAEGVLHRDIKPSNILLHGDEPKLADFGLAAQLEPGGDLTAVSGVLGTPHYLAPEALRGGSAALSVASDVYALGAVLYECLTGRAPFAGASPAELASLVERSDPPSPRLLAPAVPRDLETICLTCLAREPSRRYRTAQALAADLHRFLAGQSIHARPAGLLDRWRRFAGRHRAIVGAATLVSVLLVVGTVLSAALAIRARRAGKRASTQAAISRAVSEFLQHDLLAQASPEEQPERDLTLRTVLDRAAGRIEGRFSDQPLVEAALRMTIAATYESLGEFEAERPQLARALELRRTTLGARDPATLEVLTALTLDLQHCGRYQAAEAAGREAWAGTKTVLGEDDPRTLAAANNVALTWHYEGKYGPAAALFQATLERRQRVLGPGHADTLETMADLGTTLRCQGNLPAAEALQRRVFEARQRTFGPEHPATVRSGGELAAVYFTEGKFAEADRGFRQQLDVARRVLGAEAPDTLTVMNNLALTEQAEGRLADAAALLREVVSVSRRVRGPEHPNTLNSMNNLALTYLSLDDYGAAEQAYGETLAAMRQVLGPEHPTTIGAQISLAMTYGLERKLAGADALVASALALSARVLGPEHATTLTAMNAQAVIATAAGRYAAAITGHRRTLELRRRVLGREHPATATSLHNLARAYDARGDAAAAEPLYRESLDIRRRKLGPTNVSTLESLECLGALCLTEGRFAEAEPLLREAGAGYRAALPGHWRAAVVDSELGEALLGLRRPAEAEPLLVSAYERLQASESAIPPALRSVVSRSRDRLAALPARGVRSPSAGGAGL